MPKFPLLFTFVLTLASVAFAKEVVKIGVMFPMTAYPITAEPMRDGILLRQKELDAQQTRYEYKFVFEDAYLESARVLNAYQRLVSLEGCQAIISLGGPAQRMLKPRVANDKVYLLGITMEPNDADGKYSFIHYTHPKIVAEKLVAYLKDKGYKRPFLLTMRLSHTMAMSREINNVLKEEGVEPAGEFGVNPGELDLRTIILKASQTKPDIFIIELNSPQSDICLKQIHEQMPGIESTSAIMFDDVDDIGLLEGKRYVSLTVPNAEFSKKCLERGVKPRNFVEHGYDMADLLINAFEYQAKDKTKTPGDYLKSIKSYPGATGVLTMQSDGVIDAPVRLVIIKDGKRVPAE